MTETPGPTPKQASHVIRHDKRVRDAQAHFCWQLKMQGWTHSQIAEEAHAKFNIPFSYQLVSLLLRRHAEKEVKRQVHDRQIARQLALDELDVLRRKALDIMHRPHFALSRGEIVLDPDGTPVLDDAPALAAIDRVLKIQERHARLEGLDAPSRVDHGASQIQPDPVVFQIIRDAKARLQLAQSQDSPLPTSSPEFDAALQHAAREQDIEDAEVVEDNDYTDPEGYDDTHEGDYDDPPSPETEATLLTFPSKPRLVPNDPPPPPVF